MQAVLNDTIGFISDLPPKLFAAFASTLEDAVEAVRIANVMFLFFLNILCVCVCVCMCVCVVCLVFI